MALTGKTMIVQATNIGFDVGGGQFDVMTPGGGVGAFDACSFQWNVDKAELGATYGGFMTYCQQQSQDHATQKQCVLDRCAAVFDEPGLAELKAGCEWYVGWYEAADNPNLKFQEVACPAALVAISGIDRGPLDDVMPCGGGGGTSPRLSGLFSHPTNAKRTARGRRAGMVLRGMRTPYINCGPG